MTESKYLRKAIVKMDEQAQVMTPGSEEQLNISKAINQYAEAINKLDVDWLKVAEVGGKVLIVGLAFAFSIDAIIDTKPIMAVRNMLGVIGKV